MMSVQPRTGHVTRDPLDDECTTSISQKTDLDPSPIVEDQPDTSDLDLTWNSDRDYDECVYYHEGSDLYAEDVDGQMAVLPEVPVTTEDVKIEDILLCGSDNQTPEEIERLRQKIWKFRHLLIGKGNTLPKGNALPPAARGVVCDIDVGEARPIALKCCKLRIQFREKLADLIKGLLSAKMINYSRSPWASPIVVIIKKDGVDIRLCISLTQLMIYPMPLINDLREDLESTLCTPFGLFEWNRMPFDLKNAPQIYQRMIDNALYGFTRIPKSEDHGSTSDVFEDGESVDPGKPSVLGRRSYSDDILIPANNWDQLCDRVEGLLEACDKWNLSISVVKSFWGMPKVEYLEHKVSYNGLEANPKDLSSLTDLAFPGSLRAMQGSLNYYSRFIEDYAIYASVLYELREIDFAAMTKEATQGRIQQVLETEGADPRSQEDRDVDHRMTLDLEAPEPLEEYDQIYYPVAFASRTLKSNELNYGIAEKEVLALLRILDLNYNALVGHSLREEVVRELRIDRIRQAQDEESWIRRLKKYLVGEIRDLTQEEAKMFGSIAMNYEVGQLDLLFYCPTTKETAADRDKLMRLVIPETRQQDILHHYPTSLQGGHQGVDRTYDRIRDHFHWRGKGRPRIQGESPGNPQATYPFQIIVMDHIPSLPSGNTELLIFVDLFSRYVIAKASASRSTQTIAETYEECVFRRFGASEVIRHDREPGFMSDFFKSFNKILGQHSGSRVWLYLDRVREGYAKKLAHLWHGPFHVAEKIGEYAVRLKIAGSAYSIFPVVHVSKIKLIKVFPDRPLARLNGSEEDRVDFDEALLPEDSWIRDRDPDEYEVERISDMGTGKRTRGSKWGEIDSEMDME
ncbi:reverse transcriptase [Phytophthora megakarya]|uniref:Reverse transcriptase n=1 Tax=Phytophthora megakarya TaxID=4795 RepID=A0A225W1K5_9STRA|nr:reverse transcriptase [Phytophthora megakarya]